MNNDMDRHIQQTNDRLLCIKQHLGSPGGFQNAARELLEWCSDARAFQKPFEGSLIACLTIVNQVAAQPGYDLDLGYRLLAVCAAHRDKFSKNSAALLSMWCEELGRLLLLRHQKNRGPDSAKSPGMHPQLQKQMPPVPPSDCNAGWAPGSQGQQGLNVVTTVWGVTNSTQSGPFTHNTPGFTNASMSTTNYTQQPQGFPGNQMQKGQYMPGNMPYRREPGPYARPCYPPTPNTPGTNPPISGASSDMHAPPAALSAAALVAAAATATATATATASMVALQEQQNQQQQMNMQVNMNSQYGGPVQMQGQQAYNPQYPGMPGQRHPGPINMGSVPGQQHPGPINMGSVPGGAPGPMKGAMVGSMPNNMYPRRSAPYPNPSQLMHQKRQAQYPNGGQYGPQGPYGGQQQQYSHKPQYPAQQPLPSPTYGPQPMRPAVPAHYTNGQNPYMGPNQYPQGRPQPQGQGFTQFPGNPAQNPNFQGQNYQHSPIPGNPTPPMTPGTVPPPYPGQDMKPNLQDFKPQIPFKKADELRLTFPVRDGVMLEPFRLEHNLAVSNHVFHLRESVYQTLIWRSDLELQLKCFHHEDRQMSTNWPASVTVSVNANPLNIERGENKTSHKPLYLKEVCQPGRNTIQITVTACCCSHLFVLQLVHRPSVRSVLQGLLRKRLLPAEHCITKIKRNFSSVAGNNTINGDDGVEQTAIKVSLKCPITFRRITLPARGQDCKHIQCFDLESYLQLNCERGSWRCPVCNKTALLEGLEIDQYIWGILTNLDTTDFEEVTIDPTARWKPVPLKTIKKEETDPCGVNEPWMRAMSPSGMQMPTMSSLDMGPQPSPYSMPPSVQGPPFPGGCTGEGPGSYPHQSPSGDFPAPLSHMPGSENMNSNDIEKTLNNGPGQFPPDPNSQHLQHSSHMPQSSQSQPGNHSNGSHPLSHQPPNSSQQNNQSDCHNISDLNFDPTAIIDGENAGQGLDLPLENLGDPLELLSYLGPSEGSNDPTSGQNTNNTNGNNGPATGSTGNPTDDLLAFFE